MRKHNTRHNNKRQFFYVGLIWSLSLPVLVCVCEHSGDSLLGCRSHTPLLVPQSRCHRLEGPTADWRKREMIYNSKKIPQTSKKRNKQTMTY